jgi:glycosyltransferase involved in cell wall biosynthesis
LADEPRADAITLYQAMQLAHFVRQRKIGHLHAHFATLPAAVARLASKLSGVPFTLTAHAKDIFHESVDPHDLASKLNDAAAVITVSDFNVKHLLANHGLPPGHVVRVYNGMPLERFSFEISRRQPHSILAVGRLVPKKGFDDLVRACAVLSERNVRFHCRIVGGGSEAESLQQMIAERGLVESVQLTGPIPQSKLQHLVREATVFATPCVVSNDGDRDGLPTVLLEAMALGTPCVATPVTGIPEVISHEKTGLLVPSRDPVALADALQRTLENPKKAEAWAVAARTRMERAFDSLHTSRQLREVFLRAAGVMEATELQEAG